MANLEKSDGTQDKTKKNTSQSHEIAKQAAVLKTA